MSPADTITAKGRISGLGGDRNSSIKNASGSKKNKNDKEKLKNATFNGFSNQPPFTDIAAQPDNRGMSNTADLASALDKNNNMKRSYLSDGELAKSLDVGFDHGSRIRGSEEEERKMYGSHYEENQHRFSNSQGPQMFAGNNLASSQVSNNQDESVSEDSLNQRQDVSGNILSCCTLIIVSCDSNF